MLRAQAGELQRVVKALAQLAVEGERPAQIQHVALNGPALGKTRDGLVYHCLIDAGGDVARGGALVDQRLDVAFGEHTAPVSYTHLNYVNRAAPRHLKGVYLL